MAGILVVGASGFIGSHLATVLAQRGEDVRVATRNPEKAKGVPGRKPVRFEYTDASTYASALEGVDRLFLLAPNGVPEEAAVGPFLDAALGRVKRVVFMSALGVDASDEIPLRKLELKVEKSGVDYAVLRPNWFAQNFQTYWYEGIKAAGVVAVPAADAKTAFIDTRDIAEAAAAALTAPTAPNSAFNLSGPEALTYAEAAAILSRETGKQIAYTPITDAQFKDGLVAVGVPADYADLLVALFQEVRAGHSSAVTPDFTKLTGKAPRTLAEYARDFRAAFA